MRIRNPPAFHFSSRKWTPITRVCLIASALVHISFAAFILIRFHGLPQGLALLALPFLALGVASLWGFPRLLGVLSGCYAVAAFILIAIGAVTFGERGGAHLIALGLASPLLANAILLGYAHGKLRRASPPFPDDRESLAEAMVWMVGAVLLGFTLWILRTNALEAPPGKTAIDSIPTRTETPPSHADIVSGAGDEGDQQNPEIPAASPELSGYRKAFLEAVLRQSLLVATTDSAPGGPPPPKRYLGAACYSSEDDVYAEGTKPSSLSCRAALLRGLLPQAISKWPGETRFRFSGPMQGDGRFHSFRCREFPDNLHYYDLDLTSRADSGSWRPMTPSYQVEIEVPRHWKDSARWASGTLSPDSMLENASVSFVVIPASPMPYESSSGLILLSASKVDSAPFPYSRVAGPGTAEPVWDPSQRLLSFRTEIRNIGATAITSLIWTQQYGIPARNSPDNETENSTLLRAALSALSRDGGNMILAEGETRVCRGDLPFQWSPNKQPVLGPDVLDPHPLILSDLDGDGDPEILLDSRVLGKRWIFIGRDGTRSEAVIRPPPVPPPCC